MMDEVAIKPTDLYLDAHQKLYTAMVAIHESRRPVSATLLIDHLQRAGQYEVIGGAAYLYEVLQSTAVASHARYYADIVLRLSRLRQCIHAGTAMIRAAWEPAAEPDEVLAECETALTAVRSGDYEEDVATAERVAIEAVERIEAIAERGQHCGVHTGLDLFDAEIGGLFAEELTILAARPSVGKSAFASQIAYHVAAGNRLVYFVSLEMSSVELALRTIAGLSGVNGRVIRTGKMQPGEVASLAEAANRYGRCAMRLDRRTSMRVYDIQRTARRMVKDGLKLVVIDYLQLIQPADTKAPREQQVAGIAKALKNMARDLKVPVLCLCQLNRAAAGQERPTLANLRESGAIEQDADMVMLLNRPPDGIYQAVAGGKKGERVRCDWPAELELAKNRNGEVVTLKLDWEPEATRFHRWGAPRTAPEGGFSEFHDFSGNGDW